jgi:hypothetical protein
MESPENLLPGQRLARIHRARDQVIEKAVHHGSAD